MVEDGRDRPDGQPFKRNKSFLASQEGYICISGEHHWSGNGIGKI